MKLNEFIEILQELKSQGHGDKNIVFDDYYDINGAYYQEEFDRIDIC